jgi:hypothetical protein
MPSCSAVTTILPLEVVGTISKCSVSSIFWCYVGSITLTYKKIKNKSMKSCKSETFVNWKNVCLHFLLQIISSAAL